MRWWRPERRLTSQASVAVVTMVRDESVWLPFWVRHYSSLVGVDHLLVLDDHTADGSTSDLPCEVRAISPLPGGSQFEPARMRVASRAAGDLLRSHDWVVFADADEFVVAHPSRYGSLGEQLADRPDDGVLGVLALNVLHHADSEEPLDLSRPLLEQRSFAQFAPLMCKPVVKRLDTAWGHSSHGIRAPFRVDPDLYMLHTKFADRDLLARNVAHRSALVADDGRAGGSSWSRTDLVEILDRRMSTLDPATVPTFDPATLSPGALTPQHEPAKDLWRAPRGQKQAKALATQPIVRIPEILTGTV